MSKKTTRMRPTACVCGYVVDAATSLSPGRPVPKDDGTSLTVCIRCARAYRFGKGFTLEPLDVDTIDDAEMRALIRRAQAAVSTIWKVPS